MFDSILQFVKEIFIIGIISEIFTARSDTKKYRNQISFITGLMITTVCLKGVFNIINIDYSNKQSNYFDQIGLFSQELELKEFNNKSSEPLYLQEYINTNTEFIEKIAYEYGFNTLNTIINMDGAEIDSIEVVVTGEKNMDKCMELKLELSELYELDLSQIKVYWRKK